jgi:hypothetical protein
MPRVNRDLQRRMAARRERERRRPPAERRYRFAPSGDAVETPTDTEDQVFDGAPDMAPATETPPSRSSRTVAGTAKPAPAMRTPPKTSAKPFSEYAAEYAYVATDLRRIAVVVGSLLVVLIALHFVLPR